MAQLNELQHFYLQTQELRRHPPLSLLPRKGTCTYLLPRIGTVYTVLHDFTLPNVKVLSHLSMVFETPGCLSGSKIPETQSLVPRSRQSVVSVTGQNDV